MVFPNIRALREDKDLKQREVADILHVAFQDLANISGSCAAGIPCPTAECFV